MEADWAFTNDFFPTMGKQDFGWEYSAYILGVENAIQPKKSVQYSIHNSSKKTIFYDLNSNGIFDLQVLSC